MFAVLYRWSSIDPESVDTFKNAWAERTQEIKSAYGTFGSRLHRAQDGSWIAYAAWPSQEAWEDAGRHPKPPTPAQAAMLKFNATSEVLFLLQVESDLLDPLE